MNPAGYMAKYIAKNNGIIKNKSLDDIYSLSSCISKNFCDYIKYWKHNSYWLFDSQGIITEIAGENNLKINNLKIFYYEVYPLQYYETRKKWEKFIPEKSFFTNIQIPVKKKLKGFDVVSFSCGTAPECSPLSCNNLAENIMVNKHSLLESSEQALELLEKGFFNNSEPGPFRIFAVYSLD